MFEYDSEKTQTYRYYFKHPRKFVGSYKAYDALESLTVQSLVRIGGAHLHKTSKAVFIVLAIFRNSHSHPFVLAMDSHNVVHKIAPKKLGPELEAKSMTVEQAAKWQYLVSRYLQTEDSEEKAVQSNEVHEVEHTAPSPQSNNTNTPNPLEQLFEAVKSISTSVVDLQRRFDASETHTVPQPTTNVMDNNGPSVDTQTAPKVPVTPSKETVNVDDLNKIISASLKKHLKARRRYSSSSTSSDSSSGESRWYRKHKKNKKRSRRR